MSTENLLNIPSHENPITESTKAAEPAPVETPKTEAEPALSPKFAALAKKAKQAYQAQERLKAEKASIESQRKEIDQFNKYKTEATSNPLKALEALGWKYDDLVNYVLNDQKPTESQQISKVQAEIEALRKEQADKERLSVEREQQAAQRQFEETINAFKEKVTEHVSGNADKYELIAATDSQELIFDTIEEYFNKTGKIMAIDKAAELVESYLENEAEEKILKSKKFQSKLAPKKDEPQPRQSNSVSLNNSVTASSTAPGYLSPRSEQDRINRALAKLSGG
jgi:hypothetical protein